MLLSTLLRHFDEKKDDIAVDSLKCNTEKVNSSKVIGNKDDSNNTNSDITTTNSNKVINNKTRKYESSRINKKSQKNKITVSSKKIKSKNKPGNNYQKKDNHRFLLKFGNIRHRIPYNNAINCIANMLIEDDDKVMEFLTYFKGKELTSICSSLDISIIVIKQNSNIIRYGKFNIHNPIVVLNKEANVYYAISSSYKKQQKPWWFGSKEIGI